MLSRGLLFSLATVLSLGSQAFADATLKNAEAGTPKIGSIDAIRFTPDGVLLVGDGRNSQLIAVETGDAALKPLSVKSIEKIDDKLAGRIGTTGKGIEILHVAVNPKTRVAFFAVRKLDDKKTLLLTLDGDGKVNEFPLENVKHVAVTLPKGEKSPVSRVTDLAFLGDRVIVGAVCSEEFASKVCTVPLPLDAKAAAKVFGTETYHVSHKKWETRAPMTALMAFEEQGKKFVVGAFACTPVVRYPIEEVQPNAQVKGESILELGSGNQPRTMFTYDRDGKSYVLMNTFRFHHKTRPFGWSPYWTARIDMGLVGEKEKVNEKAINRLAGNNPATDKVKFVDEYLGVIHMDKFDKENALVVREEEKGGLTLAILPLP